MKTPFTIFELVAKVYGLDQRKGFFATVEGAKAAAGATFAEIQANYAKHPDTNGDYGKIKNEIEWSFEQPYWNLDGRKLPDGDPCWIGKYGEFSTYHIIERTVCP